ncbi:MAG: hypothetical protein ACOCYU_02430 [Brevefilum sp.]
MIVFQVSALYEGYFSLPLEGKVARSAETKWNTCKVLDEVSKSIIDNFV